MKALKFFQKFVLLALIGVSVFALTGCADSKYVDTINPALANYNAALGPLNAQIQKVSADNTLVSNATWQSDTKAALDKLDQAGKAFANLPPAPDRLKSADDLIKQLAFETNSVITVYNQILESKDLSQLDAANKHVTNVNNLITQINDAIAAANK